MAWLIRMLHRFLLRLPPETAHHVAMAGLRAWQWWSFRVRRARWSRTPSIRVRALPQLSFPSRVGLAAGFDKNAAAFAGLARLGFGFLEVGTVTPHGQSGNPKPRIWRVPPQGLINHLGFNNCGLETFRRNVQRYREFITGVPLFANVGKNKATPNEEALADYQKGIAYLAGCVDGFVCNLSSPNTPGLRDLQTESFLEGLARVLPADKPSFLKLSPDLDDAAIASLCEYVAREPRFSGVVLTNTSRKLAETLRNAPVGGMSGTNLAPRALECVAIARSRLKDKTVIGSGGIVSVENAKKMRAAGADLVEMYTGFVYGGPELLHRIQSALDA